ncbi:MAG: mucoidy inhibitor MuiA family protein [Deltaproteobacteria bacterium]|nr:mucoidy inhibitor MuiA family protein [Deltaproteobacteria bacterium]
MKRLLGFISLFLLAAVPLSAQETVPSRIKEVTLFSNQAQIKREARVKADKGLNEFLIEVGAFRIDRDSVSAKVFGEGTIYSVQFKDIPLKESPQKNIKELEKRIKDLKRSLRDLQNRKDALEKEEEFLGSLINFSQTQIPLEIKTQFPKTEDLKDTLRFLTDAYGEIRTSKESLLVRIEDGNEEMQLLKKALASLKSRRSRMKRVIEILFNSAKEQSVSIEAGYLVENAFWNPLYKADVPLNLKEVNLTMFSKIRQKTGEDWNDTRLSISNAIPLRGVMLPPFNSWLLDQARPRPLEKMKSSRVLDMAKLTDEALSGAPSHQEAKEAEFVSAFRKELPLSFEYQLPQAISIESRDKDTMLPLFSKNLKGRFFYLSVPRANPMTFLVCRMSADKELLAGAINVSFGGRFVGKTFLSEKKAGQEFDLNLGADRELKVRREKIRDKIKETFFGKIERGTLVRELEYKITVENLKHKDVRVDIIDSIPVSRTDKIVVKDQVITPRPKQENYQDKEGVMLWEFDLKPGQQKEIRIRFVVTYPKDTPVAGL